MNERKAITGLVIAAIVLPMAIVVLAAVSKLLAAMGDSTGGYWVIRVALAAGIAWLIDLVLLLIALGLSAIRPSE